MYEMIEKIWNYLRNKITYQHFLLFLLLCILFLSFFAWPSINDLFQKKQNYSLDIPLDTIPFLIIEKDEKNILNNNIYFAFWDMGLGKIFRDDTIPVCSVSGDIGQIFWTGNKQIFLSPANERGTLSILSQDPNYQILVKNVQNLDQTIIKPSYDSKRVYELSINSQNGTVKLSYSVRKKLVTFETSVIEGFPDYQLVKPIFFIPDNQNPILYCFFEQKNKPNMGLGVLEGTLGSKGFTWNIWREYDENIKLGSISHSNFYHNEMVISIDKDLHIERLTNKKEVYDLVAANNYLTKFHSYLFGPTGSEKFIYNKGMQITEQGIESPTIQVFGEYMLMNWKPASISDDKFCIRQVIAMKGNSAVGRIEIIDDRIRMFCNSMLLYELVGDNRYLSTRWIFPNE